MEKFEGCLVGVLLGDCLGAPFEEDLAGKNVPDIPTFFQNLMKNNVVPGPSAGRNFRPSKAYPGRGEYHYTDDTAMTFCLARSLLEKKEFDAADVARRFTTEYFNNQECFNEYGNAVRDVFRKLKNSNYHDPYKPAKEQFGGRGSYGNGASMRVAPVALLYKSDIAKLIQVARSQAQLTHSHKTGYNGSILQCLAIYLALKSNPETPLDVIGYVDKLLVFMDELEEGTDGFKPFCFKLMVIRKILSDPTQDPTPAEIAKEIGNDITAQGSVPTAIYCFLRSQRPLSSLDHESPFVRCLHFAVSCGGDTDTIASMACAITGARHGIGAIPRVFQRLCQGVDEMTSIADTIEEIVNK
ncbi:ADP-ribosylhydrolase ARH3-like isoform X2 [Ornithodoros turicata]